MCYFFTFLTLLGLLSSSSAYVGGSHKVKETVNKPKSCFTNVDGTQKPRLYSGLTRPCCNETSINGRATAQIFSCEDAGGCCGDYGSQSCCHVPNSSLPIYLGVGITVGILAFVLGIVALAIYCYLRHNKKGQEIYCAGCCRCKVRDTIQPVEAESTTPVNSINVETTTFDTVVYEPRHQPYPDPDVFRTPVTPLYQTIPATDMELPPSYKEVVCNPEVPS